MNYTQVEKLTSLIRNYWKNLSLEGVKKEFTKYGLLNSNMKLNKHKKYVSRETLENNFESYLIYGLELIPSNYTEGINLCPFSDNCKSTCLAFSGRASLINLDTAVELNTIIKKRVRRTFLFKKDREYFESILKIEIENKNSLALLEGKTAFFRLNVFSDIDYSKFINSLPQIKFYDYTKVLSRKPLENYKLTYSFSENMSKGDFKRMIENFGNVAVVFEDTLPDTFLGYTVIDGDLTDLRWLDHKETVIGLSLKKTIGKKDVQSNKFTQASKVL